MNLGVVVGLWRDRINLVVDVYDKTSKDMLMDLQLPSYMGTRGNQSSALAPPKGNYGTINNKGIEISLNTRNMVGAFEWDTDIQWSANKNTLEALDGTANAFIEGYGQWSDVVTITNVGESLYNFYGYKVVGVYKDLADLQSSPKSAKYPEDGQTFDRYNTVWVGDLKFADLSGPDGKPDGVIDEYDRTNIGSPMPKFTFGVTNTFRYKNFDLTLFLNGSYGNKIFNYTAMQLSNMKSIWDNQLAVVNDRASWCLWMIKLLIPVWPLTESLRCMPGMKTSATFGWPIQVQRCPGLLPTTPTTTTASAIVTWRTVLI